jgi:hypothetical protein
MGNDFRKVFDSKAFKVIGSLIVVAAFICGFFRAGVVFAVFGPLTIVLLFLTIFLYRRLAKIRNLLMNNRHQSGQLLELYKSEVEKNPARFKATEIIDYSEVSDDGTGKSHRTIRLLSLGRPMTYFLDWVMLGPLADKVPTPDEFVTGVYDEQRNPILNMVHWENEKSARILVFIEHHSLEEPYELHIEYGCKGFWKTLVRQQFEDFEYNDLQYDVDYYRTEVVFHQRKLRPENPRILVGADKSEVHLERTRSRDLNTVIWEIRNARKGESYKLHVGLRPK